MFVGRDSNGHITVTGSWLSEDPEWKEWRGTKPSDLLLVSLASCSAHDVVMILERQRKELIDLHVSVEGKQLEEPPYNFTDIHLHYRVSGMGLSENSVSRAIQLSQDKYCSVAATVRGVANLTYTYEINET